VERQPGEIRVQAAVGDGRGERLRPRVQRRCEIAAIPEGDRQPGLRETNADCASRERQSSAAPSALREPAVFRQTQAEIICDSYSIGSDFESLRKTRGRLSHLENAGGSGNLAGAGRACELRPRPGPMGFSRNGRPFSVIALNVSEG
jgi:hypothetical protein